MTNEDIKTKQDNNNTNNKDTVLTLEGKDIDINTTIDKERANTIPITSDVEIITNLDKLDPKKLTASDAEKISEALKKTWDLLSPEQKEYQLKKAKHQQDKQDAYEKSIDEHVAKEVFRIPLRSKTGNTYHFIGYDADQYQEMAKIGAKADSIPINERDGNEEYIKLEIEIYRKMILYSLENIDEEIVNKISYRDLKFLHTVFKRKNEEPLPFLANE